MEDNKKASRHYFFLKSIQITVTTQQNETSTFPASQKKKRQVRGQFKKSRIRAPHIASKNLQSIWKMIRQ